MGTLGGPSCQNIALQYQNLHFLSQTEVLIKEETRAI